MYVDEPDSQMRFRAFQIISLLRATLISSQNMKSDLAGA